MLRILVKKFCCEYSSKYPSSSGKRFEAGYGESPAARSSIIIASAAAVLAVQ
jgi:hypothetical protein